MSLKKESNTAAAMPTIAGRPGKEAFGAQGSVGGHSFLPYSPALRVGHLVFVSGQVPVTEEGDIVQGSIVAQTHQVIANVRRLLSLAACTLSDVAKVSVYLADTRDFPMFNEVYSSYFGPGLGDVPPARTTVKAELILDVKIEMDVMACVPESRPGARGDHDHAA